MRQSQLLRERGQGRACQLRERWRFASCVLGTTLVISVAIGFGFYPAFVTTQVVFSSSLRQRGRMDDLGRWFEGTRVRYEHWARDFVASHQASKVDDQDVAATEWPMFGSVYWILSTEELLRSGDIALTTEVRSTLELAAAMVADPATGTWVRRKWGPDYLDRENVFYRMLLVLGLDTYARITNDRRYDAIVQRHAQGLTAELLAAPLHVLDDYPGECYPNDVIWAVAAIGRTSVGSADDRLRLAREVTASLSGTLADGHGLPPMLVGSRTGIIEQPSRGCSNSGLLSFAYELDQTVAANWYARYQEHFWKQDAWVAGFGEHPHDGNASFADVDSGPIWFGIGTVASLFGIGAARSAGRFDHAAPMTMEAIAAAWPTPFGLLVPGFMGWVTTDSWCLGETVFLFAMTRPVRVHDTVAFTDPPPLTVIGFVLLYAGLGCGLLYREWRFWRRRRPVPRA